ncbi:MAG: phosphatase PAP2 family protein, partial [Actinomycetota bacterium]|nr:phosphatase PAP2 family protein [Actinomycetota bacterium]
LMRWLRRAENRAAVRDRIARQREKPVVGPVVRSLEPVVRGAGTPARFVWDRVTPGALGLELTTLFAVIAVGAFAVVFDLVRVEDMRSIAGDAEAMRLAHALDVDPVVSIVKVVTALGTFGAAAALIVAASAFLVSRGDRTGPAVLVPGFLITWIVVRVAKAGADRPRPAGSLVETVGSAFPSGHAANAIAWAAVGVALARALRGRASEVAFATIGVIVAVAIGLSRVLLGAHYLSDVVAGWGLGAAIYALCGVAALFVGRMRNNRRRSA